MGNTQFQRERIISYIDPPFKRSPFTASRIAVFPGRRPMPVLRMLAVERFGTEWQRHGLFPFWIDGNYRNEVPENVGLASRALKNINARKGVGRMGPGYHRRWHQWKIRAREAQRRLGVLYPGNPQQDPE